MEVLLSPKKFKELRKTKTNVGRLTTTVMKSVGGLVRHSFGLVK